MFEAKQKDLVNSEAMLNELREQRLELEKEKVRFRDERNALYKQYRELGRNEADMDIMLKKIMESGKEHFEIHETPNFYGKNSMFVPISDMHLGAANSNSFGEYNSDIAKRRLQQYLDEIISIQKLHGANECYVGLLGDLINSNIHMTIQITNRENVIEQIQKCSEMLSAFIYELSKVFEKVYVNSVAGNHTRLGKKDDCLRNERTDDLIPWYISAKLAHIDNIEFITDQRYDATIATLMIRGKLYFMVHGDMDAFSEQGVSKLVLMTGTRPDGIFYGHKHTCSCDDIAGIKIVRSGSFAGTGDDFCITKRIYGNASQMVCVLNDSGIKALYPVELY